MSTSENFKLTHYRAVLENHVETCRAYGVVFP